MGGNEIMGDIAGLIGIATSIIGFATIWIRIGVDKGRQEEKMKTVIQKTEKNEQDVTELKNKTYGIELRIAEFMGELRVKLEYIQKNIEELKPKGGRRAAAK